MTRIATAIHIFAAVGAILLGLSPALSHASPLDEQLDCKSTGHGFILPLLQSGEIPPKPMRVESNSINAFRPSHGTSLTAFDFHVIAVLGFEKNDPIFKQGSGEPIADSAYGVVVSAPVDDVQDRIHQAGSTATTREVMPLMTVILCKSQ
jgi:hypothetical protein